MDGSIERHLKPDVKMRLLLQVVKSIQYLRCLMKSNQLMINLQQNDVGINFNLPDCLLDAVKYMSQLQRHDHLATQRKIQTCTACQGLVTLE